MGLTVRHGGGCEQEVDAGGAGPVTHQRHVPGVAAERDDVLLEPVECGDLVHQAEVGGRPLVRVGVGVEETCTDPPVKPL